MNMRKIIAVLAAVLMLCSIIPMSVFAAPGDVIISKNFDDGSYFTNGSNENGYMVFDATIDDWYNVYMYANAIKSGTKYEITFDCKANKATNLNVKINNNWKGDTFKWTTNVTTEWATYTCVINPDELATLTSTALLMFTSNANKANGAIYHIDNVVVTEYAEPIVPGTNLFVNGDFETGNTNGWNKHQQTSVTAGAAKDGSYGAYLNGDSASWGGVLDQNVNVEDGKTYVFSFDYKAIRQGFNYTLSGVQSGTKYNSGYISTAAWTHVEKEITIAGDTQLKLNFNCGGQTGTDEMYVDNVTLKEVVAPDFDGYIYNGGFETGDTVKWENLSGNYTVNMTEGNGSANGITLTSSGIYNQFRQKVTVEPNTNYVVRVAHKNTSNITLLIKNGADTANLKQSSLSSSDAWAIGSAEFNSGDNTAVWVSLMSTTGAGNGGTFDDIFMFEKVDASNDGYIVNGTFETGDLSPWVNLWGSCPTAEIVTGGQDSSFALHVVSGQWKHVRQMPIAVEPNTEYGVSVWAKDAKNMSLLIKGLQDDKNTETSDIKNIGTSAGSEWTKFEGTFNSGNHNYIIVSFMGGAAEAYGTFDNVVMTKLHTCNVVEQNRVDADCENDGYIEYACDCGLGAYTETIPATGHAYAESDRVDATCVADGSVTYTCGNCGGSYTDTISATGEHTYDDEYDVDCNVCGAIRATDAEIVTSFGGNSVSEDVSGLAFKFNIVANIAIGFERISEIDYANSYIGEFKLIAMGAVASNNGSATILDNVGDGMGNVIDIPARWLCNLVEGSASFAVRITEIPENHYDTIITARPYYVYENAEGDQFTIYGEEQAASYNG